MEKTKVEVIIPTYRPGKEFADLIRRLWEQEHRPDRILVMNTEEKYWDKKWEACPILEVCHLKKKDFDHGGTRRRAALLSQGEIMIFMTQDALPADRKLIGSLIRPLLENTQVGAAYARQLPREDCSFLERYTRSFNYPEEPSIKMAADTQKYGIKTYFCSNVCAAYKKEIYESVGGFPGRAIFNEDMICAGRMVQAGYGVAYVPEAKVLHSHNYSCMQQFHRNFDLGVSQAEHPEIFAAVPSEGEGLRLVKKTLAYLCKTGHIWLIPQLVLQSGAKYAGYFLGKRYAKLPGRLVRFCTMNPSYWEGIL